MEDRIMDIYQALQGLEIKATPMNISIMKAVYGELKRICTELEEKKNEREEDRTQDCAE